MNASFVTYTSGQHHRLLLCLNLILSLMIKSPFAHEKLIIAALDQKACQWCKLELPVKEQEASLKFHVKLTHPTPNRCYCFQFDTNLKGDDAVLHNQKHLRPDPIYMDILWLAAVRFKVLVMSSILKENEVVIFADADCALNASFDKVLQTGFGNETREFSTAVTALCDVPALKRANTGFLIVYRTDETLQLLSEWLQRLKERSQGSDQSHFHALTETGKRFSELLECVEESHGFATYGHIFRGLAYQELGKKLKLGVHVHPSQDKEEWHSALSDVRVLHVNMLSSSVQKIEALKRFGLWFVERDDDS